MALSCSLWLLICWHWWGKLPYCGLACGKSRRQGTEGRFWPTANKELWSPVPHPRGNCILSTTTWVHLGVTFSQSSLGMALVQADTWLQPVRDHGPGDPAKPYLVSPPQKLRQSMFFVLSCYILGQFVTHWYLTNTDVKIYYFISTTSMRILIYLIKFQPRFQVFDTRVRNSHIHL